MSGIALTDYVYVSSNAGPVVLSGGLKGSMRTVADTAARDAIPASFREAGMFVYTITGSTFYQLGNDLTTWSTVTFGGGGGSGSAISVASAGALTGTDDTTFTNGTIAFVATFRDYFELNTTDTTTTTNGVTVLASFAGKRWYRCNIPSLSWSTATDIYIDNAGGGIGNDENDGLTAGTPLKTHAEWERRLGTNPVRQNTIVHYLSTHTDPVVVNAHVATGFTYKEVGTPVSVLTGTITTYVAQTGNAQYAFNDSAFVGAWSTHYGRRITLTSGTNSGAYAWIGYDLQSGNPVTTKWRKPTAAGALDSTNRPPTPGDAYKIETLTSINMTQVDTVADPVGSSGSSVQFYDLNSNATSLILSITAKGAIPNFVGCNLGAIPFTYTKSQMVLCGFTFGTYIFGGGEVNIYGGLINSFYGILADQNSTVYTYDGPFMNGSAGIYAKAGAIVEINGCSFLRTITGFLGGANSHITVDPGAVVTFPQKWQAASDIVYGTNAIRRFITNRGGTVTYKTAAAQTAVGSLSGGDFEFGTVDTGFAFDDATTTFSTPYTMTHAGLLANNDNAHSFKINGHIFKV